MGCVCFSNYEGEINFPLLIILLFTTRLTADNSLLATYFTWRQTEICVGFFNFIPLRL